MSNTYKVTGKFKGAIYASYKNEWLDIAITDLGSQVQPALTPSFVQLPLREFDLKCDELLFAQEIKGKTVAEKVALFCLKYKEHKGVAYRAQKEEKANMKTVTVNAQLLDAYFSGTQFPLNQFKSMADYIKNYNTVRDLAANGVKAKSSFPDVYDLQYEHMIGVDVSKLQRYWEHLRSLGWKKVDGTWKQNQQ
jgi:hypothetical protein